MFAVGVVEVGFLLGHGEETGGKFEPAEGGFEVSAQDGFLHVTLAAVVFFREADCGHWGSFVGWEWGVGSVEWGDPRARARSPLRLAATRRSTSPALRTVEDAITAASPPSRETRGRWIGASSRRDGGGC